MSGFNKNFKSGAAGLQGGANNASTGFQSSEKRSAGGGSSNSNPPVAFWDMEEGGEGTTVTDRSDAGNGLDLTLHDVGGGAVPTWNSGTKVRGSYSLKIAGTQDQAKIADNNLLDFAPSDSFSISLWVRNIGTGSPNHMTYVGKLANSSPYTGYEVGNFSPGHIKFYLIDSWTDKALALRTSTAHMNNNTNWHHIVVTYDGTAEESGVVIYHNATAATKGAGTLVTVTTDTLDTDDDTTNANIFTLGSRASGQHANIFLDDVAIFDYELTAAQVASVYNSGASLDVSDGIPS